LRVALFHNLPPGGARRAAFELARRSSSDIEYDLFTFDLLDADRFNCDAQRGAQDLSTVCGDALRIPISDWPHRAPLPLEVVRAIDIVNVDRAGRDMAEAIDKGRYDAVLAHHCQLLQAPPILGRTRVPVVYFLQEPRRQTFEYNLSRRRQTVPWWSLTRRAARLFDHWIAERDIARTRAATTMIVNSAHSMEFAYRAYGRHAHVSHLGVDEEVFTTGAVQERSGVLAVGSLHPMKGHGFCIREVGMVDSRVRPPLTIVYERGTAAERSELERAADAAGVELTFVRSCGDEELADLYRRAVAVLAAATVEPFGLTTIEALACGTPVIAVAEGGYREVVRDGENGLLVDRTPGTMAAAIQRMVTNSIGFDPCALRATVLPYFSWQEASARLDGLLRATVNETRSHE